MWRTTNNGTAADVSEHKTLEHLSLQCYEVLEEYSDSVDVNQTAMRGQIPVPKRKVIKGYEFRDVVEAKKCKLRELTLQSEAASWVDWARKLKTMNFFGTDFGDLINVEDTFHTSQCPLRTSLRPR